LIFSNTFNPKFIFWAFIGLIYQSIKAICNKKIDRNGPKMSFYDFFTNKNDENGVFFSHNATFTTLKGELSHVLTYYHDEYTKPITAKYFLAILRHFTKRK
jgi:hypothetical protein